MDALREEAVNLPAFGTGKFVNWHFDLRFTIYDLRATGKFGPECGIHAASRFGIKGAVYVEAA
jgi:hypothetical protein